MAESALSLRKVTRRYGSAEALRGIELDVAPGEFVALLGPSGCGKSTLLRLIAGFEAPTSGSIEIAGRSVEGLPPKARGVAMVFQSYALYPHMTAFDNIAMPLVMARMSLPQRLPLLGPLLPGYRRRRESIAADVRAVAETLGLNSLLDRRPAALSGGQRQRVALARAMVRRPSLCLMDEPLSNLDARLRIAVRGEISQLHRRLGATFLYVTHDQVEAMTMADRIALMMDGEIVQIGAPAELYARPADLRVAQFIGSMPINQLPAECGGAGQVLLYGKALPLQVPNGAGGAMTLGIRAEDIEIELCSRSSVEAPSFSARLVRIEDHGADLLLHLALETPDACQIIARIGTAQRDVAARALAGEAVSVTLPTARIHVFDGAGRRCEPVHVFPRSAARIGAVP